MTRRLQPLVLPGPAGPIEALLQESPARAPAFAALVCHPHPLHGGTMHHKVAHKVASVLHELGGAVLRFNFRGVGRSAGAFDQGAGEREDARAALGHLRDRHPHLPLWVAGFSFGAWVGLRMAVEADDVERLIAVAPPAASSDFSFLERSAKPKLVIQGDADDVCPPQALAKVYAGWAEPKTLIVVHDANHLFDRHLTQLAQAIRENLSVAARGGSR